MNQTVILNRLLDKYERSKHLFEPGATTRRVMLRVDKKELPEYVYEDAEIRDAMNTAAKELEQMGLIQLQWLPGRPVISAVILNLDRVMQCYHRTGRVHPRVLAGEVCDRVRTALAGSCTDWIVAWRDAICADALGSCRVPAFCKGDLSLLEDLLKALDVYDRLQGACMTMRAFSSRCYHDTKYFERNIRDLFLRIAQKYHSGLAESNAQGEMGIRDQLAYLGIYARPELYELSGDVTVKTGAGTIDLSSAAPYGLALPSTLVDSILEFDLSRVKKIVFIENKTNYDEYILLELQRGELAVYHGGFLSPQKRMLFSKLAKAIPPDASVFFWADIDLGGFQMFGRLQSIVPQVSPMRMSVSDVDTYHENGLARPRDYLEKLQSAVQQNAFPLFTPVLCRLLHYGVTIEQEVFLTEHEIQEGKHAVSAP